MEFNEEEKALLLRVLGQLKFNLNEVKEATILESVFKKLQEKEEVSG